VVREVNLFGVQAGRDSYPLYAQLRAEAPIARDVATGMWLVSRYDDVTRVLRDPETFSSDVSASEFARNRAIIVFTDPPDHTKMRALVSGAFTPRVIEAQRDAIRAYCDELVDRMCAKETADIVAELGYPLPVTVIARMLGVEDGDLAVFKRWSDTFFDNLAALLITGDEEPIKDALGEFNLYFGRKLAQLREQPEETLLSALVHVETEDGRLTEADLLMLCRVILVAGNETTTGLIVNAVRAFAEFPEALDRVRDDLTLLPGAIEEALRFYPPFDRVPRRATRDVELCGEIVRKGDRVLALIASANRDEAVFERADEFVIDRQPNRHLGFGLGIHYCVGAPLARLEGYIALATLLPRVRRIEVTGVEGRDPMSPGGPKSLDVRLELDRSAPPARTRQDAEARR